MSAQGESEAGDGTAESASPPQLPAKVDESQGDLQEAPDPEEVAPPEQNGGIGEIESGSPAASPGGASPVEDSKPSPAPPLTDDDDAVIIQSGQGGAEETADRVPESESESAADKLDQLDDEVDLADDTTLVSDDTANVTDDTAVGKTDVDEIADEPIEEVDEPDYRTGEPGDREVEPADIHATDELSDKGSESVEEVDERGDTVDEPGDIADIPEDKAEEEDMEAANESSVDNSTAMMSSSKSELETDADKAPESTHSDSQSNSVDEDTSKNVVDDEESSQEKVENSAASSQADEEKLLAVQPGEENSNSRGGDDDIILEDSGSNSQVKTPSEENKEDSGGLQISAITGGEDVAEAKKDEEKSDEPQADTNTEATKDSGEDSVAMETEDSSGIPAMVISEPRTISEENMDITEVEGETTQKVITESSEKMDTAEKEDGQKETETENKEESSSTNKVENLISESDSTGFKIVSVSEAKDSTEEITIDDDTDKKDEKVEESVDESGPKILETTSLSESPGRVTRSRSGSKPSPPKPYPPPATPKSDSSSSHGSKGAQRCIVCAKVGKCKYNIVRNGDVKHLCNDRCFKAFRSMPTKYLRAEKTLAPPTPPATPVNPAYTKYRTCCVCQLMSVNPSQPFLNWSSMDFCGEECLGKYKKTMKSTCGQCFKTLPQAQWATFCLKVGNEVKQFCNSECYLTYKGKPKLCPYCKKDSSKANGEFKDFCTEMCMKKFEKFEQDEDIEIIGVQPGSKEVACAVCNKVTKPKHELTFEGKLHKMCSDPCYSAFQYANKLTSNTCDNCGVYCYGEGSSPQFIQFEGHQKRFCCTKCVNTFRSANKKMVQCAWCGLRKTNFDMIERVDANNKYQLFCSLNCLSLYRVNLQATSNQSVTCDQCRKFVPAQYHLTMSDASVRNFCSYTCVMTFQGQFGNASKQPPPKKNTAAPPKPNIPDTRPSPRAATNPPQAKAAQSPIISSVTTLAPKAANNSVSPRTQTVNIKSPAQMPLVINAQGQQVKTTSTGTQQQIIIQPPPPKQVKNKSLLCKPYVNTKATSCRPSTQTKEMQTDDVAAKPIYIPVPVPIYIPTPMAMYSCPTPVPLPIPVPLPVPIFIPTTKKSAAGIIKHIKEIQERTPSDPFEAELLRMAEAVATAEKGSDGDSDKSDDDMAVDDVVDGDKPADTKTGGTETEEDMLQMALRMATEMSEPADLESVVDPLPLNPNSDVTAPEALPEEDVEQILSPRERRARNRKTATKRGASSKVVRRSKRQRRDSDPDAETPEEAPEEPAVAKGQAPDANFLLKYMYGVNAWKHWVVQKNAQLEKVKKQGSGRVKLFKTELLQCTADELNYSLCLFVKEVRKPSGDEYAADSILYLCLGIQNYLFENGRIDNIFTDIYYEKFTECLNEVVQRFKPKLNASGQLVCRIEEEHLWECKQLGAHSPHVLLNTLVYFNTKYFRLRTPEDHMRLSFSHIMKHWKKNPGAPSIPGSKSTVGRSVYLRYYAGMPSKTGQEKDKKRKEDSPVMEQAENLDNPLRCPVKLYEFYLSKCPESLKTRNDIFYLVPERSCVPDSPVWYSIQPMTIEPMAKMLHRIHLVKEVQEAYANML